MQITIFMEVQKVFFDLLPFLVILKYLNIHNFWYFTVSQFNAMLCFKQVLVNV